MSFNSFPFLAFLPLVVILYWGLPNRYRWVLLLVASYMFYATWAPTFLIWIVLSTVISYVLARLMPRISGPGPRKAVLALGIVSNLSVLFVFKYAGFADGILRSLSSRVGFAYRVPAPNLLLPVGISFYTLQSVGYLIDVYRGTTEPEKHVGLFALYNAFFPKLISGPIERAGHLLPQFRRPHSIGAAQVFGGLRLVLWGMFQKVVIADRLAVYVNEVYSRPADYTGWTIVIATVFVALQIYADFSGYSDIALGVARLFNIELTMNFRQPYYASSVSNFWRRWHISLTNWFRDYLYIPLGGNRVPRWHHMLNLFAVFLVSGLWHGAAWTFVLWGALHGLYVILERQSQNVRDGIARALRFEHTGARTAINTVTTFILVSFAWIFFQARSVRDALLLIRNLVRSGNGTDITAPWASLSTATGREMVLVCGLIGVLALVDLGRRGRLPLPASVGAKAWVRWAVYLALALAVMNLGVAHDLPFIYAGF
jgi:alginate O-acetyltransferase complex protein AlgI